MENRFLRCAACGLGQRHPVPDVAALIEMYRHTSSHEMEYPFESNAAWCRARELLDTHLEGSQQAAVLDVGCHTGRFLAALPEGWTRHGIESADGPVQVASEQHHVNVIAERLETTDARWRNHFDAVTMFDVIEHLPDPLAGLRAAAQLVKPGGLLIVSSGDLDAWTWRWLGSEHWYLQTPQHLCVVSQRFLDYAARDYGLEQHSFMKIPHRLANRSFRWREMIDAVHWGLRIRSGLYRVLHRLMQSVPGLGRLRHRVTVPWTMTLRDHLLASYVRQ